MNESKKSLFIFWGITIIAILLRLFLLFTSEAGVDGDEACFGLMAKHILTKGEYPIFLWKAHYAGALISYIAAIIFWFFGISIFSLKIGSLFFVIFSLWFTYLLACKIKNEKTGLLAASLVAIPPAFVAIFSVRAYGGHSEIMMLGPLILFLLYRIIYYEDNLFLYTALGFVSGMSLWISPATLPFLFVTLTFFIFKNKIIFSRRFIFFLLSFLIGLSPFIIYNIKNPFATLFRLGGRALDLNYQILNGYANTYLCFFERFMFRIKSIPYSFLTIPKLFLSMLALEKNGLFILKISASLIYVLCLFHFIQQLFNKLRGKKNIEPYFNIFLVFGFWAFLFFCFGGLNRPRHLIFIYPIISIFFSIFLFKIAEFNKIISLFFIGIIFLNNLSSNVGLFQQERLSFKPLISFLKSKNIFYGYGTYHIAYPIIFESDESIIISPIVDPGSDDRYPIYTQQVSNVGNICYIFNNKTLSAVIFEEKMRDLAIRYQKREIDNFLVYYNFSKTFSPTGLMLPESAF